MNKLWDAITLFSLLAFTLLALTACGRDTFTPREHNPRCLDAACVSLERLGG